MENYYGSIVKSLKDEANELSVKLHQIRDKQNDMNFYIATVKALKETLGLIKEFDWQDMYSEYCTGDDGHIEVATWKQNSVGEIKNHKRYLVEEKIVNKI